MEIVPANFQAYITNSKAISKNFVHLEISSGTRPKMINYGMDNIWAEFGEFAKI